MLRVIVLVGGIKESRNQEGVCSIRKLLCEALHGCLDNHNAKYS
jgi:hypothetical protein